LTATTATSILEPCRLDNDAIYAENQQIMCHYLCDNKRKSVNYDVSLSFLRQTTRGREERRENLPKILDGQSTMQRFVNKLADESISRQP